MTMLGNIQAQPRSLQALAEYHFGSGAEALHAAAAAIRAAGRVVFTGMGSSLYAAMPAAAYLSAHGFPALAADASELLHFGGTQDHAATVVVSRSGETAEVTRLLAVLRHHATIGVSNEPDSTLAREARLAIHLHSAPDRMVAVQTYTGTLAALLLLAGAVLEIPQADRRRALHQAIEALSATINEAASAISEWNAFLSGAQVVYLLGRGPSLASVREGALLFHEAARLFRHGPVEVVDSRFRAIVFASQTATRELDTTLAADLTALGGSVRLCSTLGVPAPFAPLVEIAPVQVAACSLALARGIDPGNFRYATLVTLSESGFPKP